MAAVQMLYTEQNADVTDTGGIPFTVAASIAAASFTANKEYLILACAFIEGSGGAFEHHIRLVHIQGVNSIEFTDGNCVIDPAASFGGYWAFFMYRFTQPAITEVVQLECMGESTSIITVLGSQIFAMKLSDDFVENTDFFWNEVTTDYRTTGTMAAQAAVTFTPNGTDDWLIIAHGVQGLPSALTTNFEAQMFESVGGTTTPFLSFEGGDIDVGDEARHFGLFRVFTPSAVAHTFSLRVRSAGADLFTVFSSRILALRLNKFGQHAFVYTEAADAPLAPPSWETEATISVTPNVTGNWFYLGSAQGDMGLVSAELNTRLQDNNSGAFASDPAYGDNGVNTPAWDATNDIPHGLMKMKSLTSGASRTINLDFNGTGGPTVKHRSLVAFSAELPSAAPSTPAAQAAAATQMGVPVSVPQREPEMIAY